MREKNNSDEKIEITDKIKELVLARIDAQTPSNLRLFIGSHPGMSKEEVMDHVRKGDEIGRNVIRMHIKFMRAVVSGEVTEVLNSV